MGIIGENGAVNCFKIQRIIQVHYVVTLLLSLIPYQTDYTMKVALNLVVFTVHFQCLGMKGIHRGVPVY